MPLPYEDVDDRQAHLETFGEPLVYFDGEQLIDLYGIVKSPYERVQGAPNRPPIGTTSTTVEISIDDVAEPKQNDLIFRGERAQFEGVFTWAVVSPRPDESERMATMVVKAAP